MFRMIVGGMPIMIGAVALKPESKNPATGEESSRYNCRPTDLPLYTPLHAQSKQDQVPHPPIDSKVRTTIEETIRAVRMHVTNGYHVIAAQKKNFEDFVATGVAHSHSTIEYLNQPDNTLPRVGAIAIGGVSGLILAVRGGFIRKIIYTGIGAGGIATLCYPKEAEKFAQQALTETKKGISVSYNFVKGVKPGDKESADVFAGFPTSIKEVKDSLADMAVSAKDSIFSSKK